MERGKGCMSMPFLGWNTQTIDAACGKVGIPRPNGTIICVVYPVS